MAQVEEILDRAGQHVSVVLTGSDLGTQRALAVTLCLPVAGVAAYRRLWDMIKRKTNAKIFYHSCGSIYPMIPFWLKVA